MGKLLDGRVALVTGGGRGIGAAISKSLAAHGALVVVNDLGVSIDGSGHDELPARTVASEISANGGAAIVDTGDVSDFVVALGMIESAVAEFGRLDILVNTAGILRDRMIFNMSEEEWDAVIRVHLKGTFNTTRHAATYWRANPGQQHRLINFTSGAGLFGAPGQPNYAAAKLGIVGLTLSCANALARYGVTANAVAPLAATRMTSTIAADKSSKMGIGALDDAQPEQVAAIVAYLASEDSGWLTGRVIGVRGRRISLYTNYEMKCELVLSGNQWDSDRVSRELERAFRPALSGAGMFDALRT